MGKELSHSACDTCGANNGTERDQHQARGALCFAEVAKG
jgi:hypothetical protein